MKGRALMMCALLLVIYSISFAQDILERKVPSNIIQKFHKLYPKAYDVEWEKEGELYKVEFELGLLEVDHDIWFDKNAEIIRHREEIEKAELPRDVTTYLQDKFKGYRIDEMLRITEGDEIVYRVKVKSPQEVAKLVFDINGQRIK